MFPGSFRPASGNLLGNNRAHFQEESPYKYCCSFFCFREPSGDASGQIGFTQAFDTLASGTFRGAFRGKHIQRFWPKQIPRPCKNYTRVFKRHIYIYIYIYPPPCFQHVSVSEGFGLHSYTILTMSHTLSHTMSYIVLCLVLCVIL